MPAVASPGAARCKRWITSEVLPAIRKPSATSRLRRCRAFPIHSPRQCSPPRDHVRNQVRYGRSRRCGGRGGRGAAAGGQRAPGREDQRSVRGEPAHLRQSPDLVVHAPELGGHGSSGSAEFLRARRVRSGLPAAGPSGRAVEDVGVGMDAAARVDVGVRVWHPPPRLGKRGRSQACSTNL